VDYFPVVPVGHGPIILQTAVVTRPDMREAVVIQYEGRVLCEVNKTSPLCPDPKLVLTNLGIRLAQHLFPES